MSTIKNSGGGGVKWVFIIIVSTVLLLLLYWAVEKESGWRGVERRKGELISIHECSCVSYRKKVNKLMKKMSM